MKYKIFKIEFDNAFFRGKISVASDFKKKYFYGLVAMLLINSILMVLGYMYGT